MSECEKAKIIGYREMNQEQIEAINVLKALEIETVKQISAALNHALISDLTWTDVGKINLRQAFMAYVRAVARPQGD